MTLSKPRLAVLEWAAQGRVYDGTETDAVTAASKRWARDEGLVIAYADEGGPAYEITEEGRKLLGDHGG